MGKYTKWSKDKAAAIAKNYKTRKRKATMVHIRLVGRQPCKDGFGIIRKS